MPTTCCLQNLHSQMPYQAPWRQLKSESTRDAFSQVLQVGHRSAGKVGAAGAQGSEQSLDLAKGLHNALQTIAAAVRLSASSGRAGESHRSLLCGKNPLALVVKALMHREVAFWLPLQCRHLEEQLEGLTISVAPYQG